MVQLKARLKALGLPVSGDKELLVARLKDYAAFVRSTEACSPSRRGGAGGLSQKT